MNATPNTYTQRATDTRNRRRAAGRYQTPAVKAAMRKYISYGVAALNEEEKTVVRVEMAKMRMSVNW